MSQSNSYKTPIATMAMLLLRSIFTIYTAAYDGLQIGDRYNAHVPPPERSSRRLLLSPGEIHTVTFLVGTLPERRSRSPAGTY